MELEEFVETIETEEDFIYFLHQLQDDFHKNSCSWETLQVDSYLEAMERFLKDSRNRPITNLDIYLSYKFFAQLMMAASRYE